MAFEVLTTDSFRKAAKPLLKKYASLRGDISSLVDSLEENPRQGKMIKPDCYKIRLTVSSKNKGKSGGARVITYVRVQSERVYLIHIYDKGERESITDSELNDLLEEFD